MESCIQESTERTEKSVETGGRKSFVIAEERQVSISSGVASLHWKIIGGKRDTGMTGSNPVDGKKVGFPLLFRHF